MTNNDVQEHRLLVSIPTCRHPYCVLGLKEKGASPVRRASCVDQILVRPIATIRTFLIVAHLWRRFRSEHPTIVNLGIDRRTCWYLNHFSTTDLPKIMLNVAPSLAPREITGQTGSEAASKIETQQL